jgi:hypothetical protein
MTNSIFWPSPSQFAGRIKHQRQRLEDLTLAKLYYDGRGPGRQVHQPRAEFNNCSPTSAAATVWEGLLEQG